MTDSAIRLEIGGEVARLLFEGGAIHVSRQQPFILAAGWASPVYVDVRVILGDPALRQAVTQLATILIQNVEAQCFGIARLLLGL